VKYPRRALTKVDFPAPVTEAHNKFYARTSEIFNKGHHTTINPNLKVGQLVSFAPKAGTHLRVKCTGVRGEREACRAISLAALPRAAGEVNFEAFTLSTRAKRRRPSS